MIRAPKRQIEEISGLSKEETDASWKEFKNDVYEVIMAGAGIGGGFIHSSKLNVIKYNQAMRLIDLD
jgi:hypothetical protein